MAGIASAALTLLKAAESERAAAAQQRDDKAGGVQAFGLFVLMGGAFHVILGSFGHDSRTSGPWAEPGSMPVTLPEQGEKRRRCDDQMKTGLVRTGLSETTFTDRGEVAFPDQHGASHRR